MPQQWRPSYNPWLIAVSVMLATFMEVMDTSIASVAVPYIAGSVSATNDEATWVLTSYLVANAVFLPSSIWFSERFGRKRFLIFSIVVFTIASFACGIANSLGFILLARAIQGAGGGALQPLSQAILMESFPPEKQGQALGLFAMGVVVAPVIGPALGGYLTDHFSWRWAFFINIPVGILAILLQGKFLEDPPYIRNAGPGRLDKIGFGLLALWSASLQFICDKGQEDDWFGSTRIRVAFVLLLIGFGAFVWREFLHDHPLLNLRILGNRNFALGCGLIFLFGMAIYSLTTILPLFYQTLMGYDAATAGLAVSPRGLGSISSALLVGYVSSKVDARKLVALGFGIFGLMSLWNSFMNLQIAPTTLFWPIVISGFALPMVFVPLSKVALGTLPQEQIGNASGLYNLLRNIGGSVGIAAANTILQRHLQTHRNEMLHSLNPASLSMRQELHSLSAILGAHSSAATAARRALALANTALNNQAQLWAYVDDFRYMALICAFCVPIAFLLARSRSKGPAPAG